MTKMFSKRRLFNFLAGLTGYVVDAILTALTEWALSSVEEIAGSTFYYCIDFMAQAIFTIIGGMIAGFLGRNGSRGALVTMLWLGLVVGIASMILSWTAEPHGYSVLLFLSFFPLAWAGWAFAR